MDKREQSLIKNKQLEVQTTPEFAAMFRKSKYRSRNNIILISLDENGKFYQYLRHHRKRTYKEIEDNKVELKEKINELSKTKADLEGFLKNTCDELDWFKKQAEEEVDFIAKLEELWKSGIIDERYDPI